MTEQIQIDIEGKLVTAELIGSLLGEKIWRPVIANQEGSLTSVFQEEKDND